MIFIYSIGIMDVVREFGETYGGPGKFWLANRLFVYINDPAHCEMILNNVDAMDKGDSYDFVVEVLGYGLITLKCNFYDKEIRINTIYKIVRVLCICSGWLAVPS